MKNNHKNSLGKKGLISPDAVVHYPGQELKADSWRQERKQRPRRSAAYRLVSHGFFSGFYIPGPATRGSATRNALGPLQQSLIKAMSYRPVYRQADGTHFPVCVFFPGNSSLCQVDKKKTKKQNNPDIAPWVTI